ncbi:MAG: pre-16S rRNA-processing nuclease YqgF [Armatimonadota bacterium]
MPPLLAVDPGREKCGVAVVTYTREVLEKEIIDTASLPLRIAYHVGRYGIDTVVLGDRTGSREVRDSLRAAGMRLEIIFVDEHRSSELGRRRFLLSNKAKGWEKLLPIGMRTPNKPYDDYVAVILAERYLDGSRSTRMRRTHTRR